MKCFFFCLVITGFALSGCSWPKEEPETNFFRDFSLGQTVERMKVAQLRPLESGSGGSTSPGQITRRRQDFNISFMIEEREGTKFDETSFLSKLKDEIGRVMGEAEVRVNGSGTSNDSFHLDYSKGDHEGWLEVIGARVEGNKYKLWGVIRENARKQKQ